MMDKLKKNMVFYLLLLIDFYIVPWFIKDTGSAMIVRYSQKRCRAEDSDDKDCLSGLQMSGRAPLYGSC